MNITPGPYHLSGNAVVTENEVVAQFPSGPHRDANMQAVAALPELIDALIAMMAATSGRDHPERARDERAAQEMARAALRRAGV